MAFKTLHPAILTLRENRVDILTIEPRPVNSFIVILTDCQTLQYWLHIIPFDCFFSHSNVYIQKNSTDRKVENPLISTTCLGLFDRPSSGTRTMYITYQVLLCNSRGW
jgi:hypothetical protein